MVETDDFIPDLLNGEPAFLLGLSLPQLATLAIRNLIVGIVIFVPIIVFITGSFLFFVLGFLLAMIYSGFVSRFMAVKLRENSKGKPEGYSMHELRIKWQRMKLKYPSVFSASGKTDSGLHLYVSSGKWER